MLNGADIGRCVITRILNLNDKNMKKYRKKPVVIEAIKLSGDNFDEVCNFMETTPIMEQNEERELLKDYSLPSFSGIYIETLEGSMLANIGDYIIKGVNGEFYPCKPDIFAKTYELVEDYL